MANTYIVTNNKFKPYTFEEMLKPYQMYTEAYNKADTELNTLLEDAATKGFNFSPQDTAEAEAYNAILGRIQTASEQLATGLNPALSKEIQQLNKDYRKVMLPIQQKMAKRSELANEQRKLLSSNSDLRFTVDYSTASLDNITSSSSYGIINLDKIYKDTATEFAGKTSKMQRDDFDPTPIGSTGYYSVKTGYGYTPEEFEDAFYGNNGSPKTDSDIYKFYKEKVDAINARTDISNDIKIEMADAVYRGMEATAGEFTTKQIAGKTVRTDGKLSDAELQALMDKAPKNSDFILDGTPYHKDDTGRIYKIGTEKDEGNGAPKPGSIKAGKPSNPIQITLKNGKVKGTKIIDLNLVNNLGVATTYDELDDAQMMEADKYIKDYGSNNFDYYINGNNLIIVPRDVTTINAAQINTEIGG